MNTCPARAQFHDVAGVGEAFGGNICHRERFVKGDPERAFAQAEEIVEESFEIPNGLPVRHGTAHSGRARQRRKALSCGVRRPIRF